MSFIPLITSGIGSRVGSAMAGKMGRQFATKAMDVMASRPVNNATSWAINKGGTIGKIGTAVENTIINKGPDIQAAAQRIGEAASPYIGAKVGYEIGRSMGGFKQGRSDSETHNYGNIY